MIKGISHPLPTKFAERIYKNNKNVFVAKSFLGKVSEGDKFILYESHGEKAYTGWANIKKIKKIKKNEIINDYGDALILKEEELKEYGKNKEYMTIIELDNFEMFKKPVIPKRFVVISGKYIYEDEFNMILKNRK